MRGLYEDGFRFFVDNDPTLRMAEGGRSYSRLNAAFMRRVLEKPARSATSWIG
jgi:hypothetical protein